MNRRQKNPLPELVESFFCGYLQRTRSASPHTVRAYRDAIKLFLIFLSNGRSVAELRLEDLQVDQVMRFLRNLEEVRKNGRATRNCRLAAIRSFFGHLLRSDPTRASSTTACWQSPRRDSARLPPATWNQRRYAYRWPSPIDGQHGVARDHALLLFLYNTVHESAKPCRFEWTIYA